MKKEWLFPGETVPVNVAAALVNEIKRLAGVVGAMALEMAAKQEPVAWGMRDINGRIYDCISVEEHARAEGDYKVPLYTATPRREWGGLTEDEAFACRGCDYFQTYKAIEAKLKEKNA